MARWVLTIKLCWLIIAVFGASFATAQARPKIGLALAGGGAKGSAHVAVIKALEQYRIPVDYIAGTSIGAYVGGLYALGYSADEIKDIMFSVGLEKGYSDAIAREHLPYRNKQQQDKFNIPLELGFRDGQIQLPPGLLHGQSMSNLYLQSIGSIANLNSFDNLAIPFRAIATDLESSQAVVLAKGNLVQSMLASATVPGALTPVEIDGRLLVDGGMSDNLPIQVVREMGADIVIAVDISSPLQSRAKLQNGLSVLRQLSGFLTISSVHSQKALLEEQDIYLRPDIDNLSTTDFTSMEQSYQAGVVLMQKQQEHLKALSLANSDYSAWQEQRDTRAQKLLAQKKQKVDQITLHNASSVSDAYLLEVLGLKPNAVISSKDLVAGIQRIYALDYFEKVTADIREVENQRELHIDAKEKSWGPNYIEAGIGWEDDFSLDSDFTLDFAFTMDNINNNGGQWRTELGLGTDKSFSTELYLPIDPKQRFYQVSRYQFDKYGWQLPVNNSTRLNIEQSAHEIELGLGFRYQIEGIVEAGFNFEDGKLVIDDIISGDINYQNPGVYFFLGYDTLNSISFPSEGSRVTFKTIYRKEDVNDKFLQQPEKSFHSIELDVSWKAALSLGHHAFVGKASAAHINSGDNASVYFTELGGFLNLSGYNHRGLVGNKKLFTALVYQYDLARSLFAGAIMPLYLGASLEAGGVWRQGEAIRASDAVIASSIYIGSDTFLGPVALAFGFNDKDQQAVYFYLGKNF